MSISICVLIQHNMQGLNVLNFKLYWSSHYGILHVQLGIQIDLLVNNGSFCPCSINVRNYAGTNVFVLYEIWESEEDWKRWVYTLTVSPKSCIKELLTRIFTAVKGEFSNRNTMYIQRLPLGQDFLINWITGNFLPDKGRRRE